MYSNFRWEQFEDISILAPNLLDVWMLLPGWGRGEMGGRGVMDTLAQVNWGNKQGQVVNIAGSRGTVSLGERAEKLTRGTVSR